MHHCFSIEITHNEYNDSNNNVKLSAINNLTDEPQDNVVLSIATKPNYETHPPHSRKNSNTQAVSPSERIETYIPFTRTRGSTHNNSIDSNETLEPELLGNKRIIFSTPFLEKYSKCSIILWNILNPVFDELEWWSSVGATCLINYAAFQTDRRQEDIYVIYAIQLVIIAQTLDKLSNFSRKIIPIREKQYIAYVDGNHQSRSRNLTLNLHDSSNHTQIINDPNSLKGVNSSDSDRLSAMEQGLSQNVTDQIINPNSNQPETTFQSAILERYYSYLACFRNVAWDHMGVYTILSHSVSASLLIWSLIAPEHNQQTYVILSSFFSIASSASQGYAKYSSQKTEQVEQRALKFRLGNQARNNAQNQPV